MSTSEKSAGQPVPASSSTGPQGKPEIPPSGVREAAAGAVLGIIASDLSSLVDLLIAALDFAPGDEEQASALIAAAALAAKVGALADRCAAACGNGTIQDADAWLLAPVARNALRTLEGAQ